MEIIHTIIAELESLAEYVIPEVKIDLIRSDPDDNRVLECALAASAGFIVTGDTHLLALKNFKGIDISAPALWSTGREHRFGDQRSGG